MKILFDADGLIKTVSSGIFLSMGASCFISQQVCEETVLEGKRRLYEDAFIIEQLIENGKITVREAKMLLPQPGLGKGELSTLALFKALKGDVIIGDDRRFLTLLDQENIPYLIPTELIVALVKNKKISIEEGKKALEKMKNLVTTENYNDAYAALGGRR